MCCCWGARGVQTCGMVQPAGPCPRPRAPKASSTNALRGSGAVAGRRPCWIIKCSMMDADGRPAVHAAPPPPLAARDAGRGASSAAPLTQEVVAPHGQANEVQRHVEARHERPADKQGADHLRPEPCRKEWGGGVALSRSRRRAPLGAWSLLGSARTWVLAGAVGVLVPLVTHGHGGERLQARRFAE